MQHPTTSRDRYADWVMRTDLIPSILESPDNYSTKSIRILLDGYMQYSHTINCMSFTQYKQLLSILGNKTLGA